MAFYFEPELHDVALVFYINGSFVDMLYMPLLLMPTC